MSSATKSPRRMRVWPAIVAPLGLTLLLGVAAWLFHGKVEADGKQITDEALRLEGYARLEAGELAGRAATLARALVDSRTAQRAEQEKNIRVELAGIMDAVYRVLSAGLEKTRAANAASRDVGDFPAGFEGLRVYLELAGSPGDADAPVEAMRACLPELSALVPAGCSLAVVENNFEEIISVGGGTLPENARVESMTRQFSWGDGDNSRHWTLQVRLGEADAYPVPDAREIAAYISERLGDARLDSAAWRGWLVDATGQAAAAFPAQPENAPASHSAAKREADLPPFIDMPREWVEIDGRRLVWQERSPALEKVNLVPAVAVAIDRPAAPPVWHEELKKDRRWSLTLGLLALLSLFMWGWLLRALLSSRRAAEARPAPERERNAIRPERAAAAPPHSRAAAQAAAEAAIAAAKAGGQKRGQPAPRQRLVRDESVSRPVTDVHGVIVADINDDGEVLVEAELHPAPPPRRPRLVIPSGSLLRLQERHRGGKGRQGSRILDNARSQLLRDLATRVRPTVRPKGRPTERLTPGWQRIAE